LTQFPGKPGRSIQGMDEVPIRLFVGNQPAVLEGPHEDSILGHRA
jgi:hypothetical protein